MEFDKWYSTNIDKKLKKKNIRLICYLEVKVVFPLIEVIRRETAKTSKNYPVNDVTNIVKYCPPCNYRWNYWKQPMVVRFHLNPGGAQSFYPSEYKENKCRARYTLVCATAVLQSGRIKYQLLFGPLGFLFWEKHLLSGTSTFFNSPFRTNLYGVFFAGEAQVGRGWG